MFDTFFPDSRIQIDAAFEFAAKFLNVKCRDTFYLYCVLPFFESEQWLGRFDPIQNKIEFNGWPTYDTIFHEAVHYQQFERGEPLSKTYLNITSFNEYYECRFEREARNQSRVMIQEYANLIGEDLPFVCTPNLWSAGCGLRSDHTCY